MTELQQFSVSWRLPGYEYEREFKLQVEATSSEAAAERMFLVANGMDPTSADGRRWTAMQHRSLSVGDHVEVNGEPWYCASAGWEPSHEQQPRNMEERIEGLAQGRHDGWEM